ncbi:spermatogenesis associated 6 like [Rhinolophus ferrumequinum]|uniref:Spermatogenesis associated 6 like n=1 Tax=Rhinolophus ferrumequinum TaxID=59479 RepID=A0A7J7VT66_RHIFE|nr:spermatogenesis associated 6 like [Rhinolophus ferrumequinum]
MPLEVVVELQIRAISCPGVFLPDKQDVYLGVYLLNQYQETDCFPSVFPIMIQQRMRFEKGIAPKIEFSTRTAIREGVFLHRNRFLEERHKSQRPLSTSYGPKFPLNNIQVKPKENNLNRLPQNMQSRAPSPYSTKHFFQDQPAQLNVGNNFRISRESKPPFVVRHVDSAKPFGENISEHHSRKSRRKSKLANIPFSMRRASSLDGCADNIKVIKEPDERIILRNESPSPLDSSKFEKSSPSYSHRGDADFHPEASFATTLHSRSPSPLMDQLLLGERFHPGCQSTWKKIHESVCGLLTSPRARQHLNKEDSISEVNDTSERPSYPLKKYPVYAQRYF